MRFKGITAKGYLRVTREVLCSYHKRFGNASFDDLAAATIAYLRLNAHVYVGYRWPTTLGSIHLMSLGMSKLIADDDSYTVVADELSNFIYRRHLYPGFRIIGGVKYQLTIPENPFLCSCGSTAHRIWMDKRHEFCDTCVQVVPIKGGA